MEKFKSLAEVLGEEDKKITKALWKDIFYITFYILLWLAIIFLFIYSHAWTHEEIHMMIYKDYNVSAHVVYYAPWDSGDATAATIANGAEAKANCNETCNLLHTQNEIVGYNTVLIGIWGIIICSIFWITHHLPRNLEKEAERVMEAYKTISY